MNFTVNTMRRVIFLGIICLCMTCAFTSSSAVEAGANYGKVSVLLFPETSSWQPVSGMKPVEAAFLDYVATELRKAYTASKVGKEYESEVCSFIERAFCKEGNFPNGFYLFDVDGDGIEDIIYIGTPHCAEGDVTLVWFGRNLTDKISETDSRSRHDQGFTG